MYVNDAPGMNDFVKLVAKFLTQELGETIFAPEEMQK